MLSKHFKTWFLKWFSFFWRPSAWIHRPFAWLALAPKAPGPSLPRCWSFLQIWGSTQTQGQTDSSDVCFFWWFWNMLNSFKQSKRSIIDVIGLVYLVGNKEPLEDNWLQDVVSLFEQSKDKSKGLIGSHWDLFVLLWFFSIHRCKLPIESWELNTAKGSLLAMSDATAERRISWWNTIKLPWMLHNQYVLYVSCSNNCCFVRI